MHPAAATARGAAAAIATGVRWTLAAQPGAMAAWFLAVPAVEVDLLLSGSL